MDKKYSLKDQLPLITIITVTYNVEKSLQKTIDSIRSQTYKNIEYIIIDGQSSDQTINIIKKNKHYISKWISKKDNGIYDAMNKGINFANGEWINFMNSGDTFINDSIIEKFVNNRIKNIDIYYGSRYILYENSKKLQKPFPLNKFYNRMPFGHQSAFISTKIMKKYKYDLHYKIASDYNFFLKCYLNKITFHNLNFVICNFKVNGKSSTQRLRTALETNNIIFNHLNENQLKKTYFYAVLEKEICKSSKTYELLNLKYNIIRNTIKELKNTSIFKYPILKYRKYKKLLEIFHKN